MHLQCEEKKNHFGDVLFFIQYDSNMILMYISGQGDKGEKGDTGEKGLKGHTGLKGDQVRYMFDNAVPVFSLHWQNVNERTLFEWHLSFVGSSWRNRS